MSATLFYKNPHTGDRLGDPDAKYQYSDAVRLLSQFTHPGVSIISTMPSGLGLDFHSEDDGTIWIEFYGDKLQHTFVDLTTAQKILERAYNAKAGQTVSQLFSDLVQKWE